MIDFEKLKLAHILAEKLDSAKLVIESHYNDSEVNYILYYFNPQPVNYCTYDLDDLLKLLNKLVNPKPKFKQGQVVWKVSDTNEIVNFVIEDIHVDKENLYFDGALWRGESELFSTKKELIDAQIIYWQSKYYTYENCFESIRKHHELKDECTHNYQESDLNDEGGTLSVMLCTKCGKCSKKECEHEPDKNQYLSNPGMRRCRKCEDFY